MYAVPFRARRTACAAFTMLFLCAAGLSSAHAQTYTAIDLNPTNLSGINNSNALAVSGSIEVGYGSGTGTGNHLHALLWTGTANSAVDLNAFLPVDYNTDSEATAVNSNGDIVGYGIGSSGIHAFLWHLNAAPPKP